ncbi:hypothetical protein A9Q83_13160 [Alphaproteobacteria bacterium 46_93_T64]|nr:hypothetical protein A9Q83_13160 [Alphaproteobacteria bacterium 46_93_T64]
MPLPYFPVESGDYKITLGLKPHKDGKWLEVDESYASDTKLKRELFSEQKHAVFASTAGAALSEAKVLSLVQGSLKTIYPELVIAPGFNDSNALVKAASLVQEDLILMQRKGNDYILGAAAVCFPSGWNLREKVGRNLNDIHFPVPGLNAAIGSSIDKFFQNLKPNKIVQRFNWGLFDDPALFQPGWWRDQQPAMIDIDADTIGQNIYFRVEKQTLQRLEDSDDILFTVRIFNTPLDEIAEDQEKTERLHHALTSMPNALRHYKTVAQYEELLLDYLKTS